MQRWPTLSLNEWAVLGVLVDKPRHGYDIAAELAADAQIGRAWRVTRALVYRALERLETLGYVETRRREPGDGGPQRTIYGATDRGRRACRKWLDQPVDHLRDVRSALLLKLVLSERLGHDRKQLIAAQREVFARLLADRPSPAGPEDDVVGLWRRHSARTIDQFLDLLDRAS